MADPKHLLTVSAEDYYHVSAFRQVISPRHWSRFEARFARNTLRVLDLLDEYDVRATFFVMGWTAEHSPETVREIAERGHEVATKGYFHRSFDEMGAEAFRNDLVRARGVIEDAAGHEVIGHRVARGRLRPDDVWALEILADEGFVYDSSVFPRGPERGAYAGLRQPVELQIGRERLWELPITSIGPERFAVPFGGGNVFRQLPLDVVHRGLEHTVETRNTTLNLYFHVWELDPDQPRIATAGRLQRLRQYRNLERSERLVRSLLERYRFEAIATHIGHTPTPVRASTRPAAEPEPVQELDPVSLMSDTTKRAVTVVVPCYNESLALPYLENALVELRQKLEPRWDVHFAFVDDASTDHTYRSLEALAERLGHAQAHAHRTNQGVAAAIQTGLRLASTELVASMDCDCSYDPLQLEQLLEEVEPDVALVTASPYHPQGTVRSVPAWRLVLSRTLSRLYRWLLQSSLWTYTSCFRVYRRSRVLDLPLREPGFLGVAELLVLLILRGERVRECPAVLEPRVLGQSKLALLHTIKGHAGLLHKLAVDRLLRAAPGTTSTSGEG